jgi:hypothetical protein
MDQNKINAAPTKRFFISVLVKDINLLDAIVELVDNSVDAARSNLPSDQFKRTEITLSFNSSSFTIQDNSGGMSVDHARNNAFRFGRPDNAPATPGTVGEFGVGMKRALFKLGRYFVVQSRTKTEYLRVEIDVNEWEKRNEDSPDAWTFELQEQGINTDTTQPLGTVLTVTDLDSYAIQELASASFENRLMETLRQAHAESLTQGVQIIINQKPILGKYAVLLESEELKPISREYKLNINSKEVQVKIIAGIGDAKLIDAGWYIYCNGRQIERAEKTEKTGWNTTLENSDKTPKAHWQFRRFRGFVYFESKHQDVLPWNTTKTSLDIESHAYSRVYPEMTASLRQVLEFLNALDSESSQPADRTALVENAKPKRISELAANDFFVAVASAAVPTTKELRISYVKEAEIVKLVKESLGVTNNRDVGQKTFDYYVQNEGLNG